MCEYQKTNMRTRVELVIRLCGAVCHFREHLLKTAKLMTTFVVLTRKGNRVCRKVTILRKMLATTPLELVKVFKPGIFRFFFWSVLGSLGPAEASDLLVDSILAFMSLPGFSLAAAINSGPRVAPNLAGRLLTRV